MRFIQCARTALLGASALALVACDSGTSAPVDGSTDAETDAATSTPTFFAVDAMNRIVRFAPATPDATQSVTITGLQPAETIVSLDVRPANNQLYALGSTSRLYVLDGTTGVATPVGSQFSMVLSGLYFGLDVNPVADRLRIVNIAQQNIRVEPDTGLVAMVDTMLTFATGDPNQGTAPHIVECAYTNSTQGASTTTLFAIDSSLDVLTLVAPPNNGAVTTVGGLGLDVENEVGFDIVTTGASNVAYAAMRTSAAVTSTLYTIDLTTGAATAVAPIGGGIVHALAYRP
jgi:hypothetical protein